MRNEKNMRAFTLIELLVVIAIIALLMGIMLPSLTKVKSQAKKIVCQTNVRQQLMAYKLYVIDHKGAFPTYYPPNGGPVYSSGTYGNWGGKEGTGSSYKRRLLNPYIGRSSDVSLTTEEEVLKVFACPSDKGSGPDPVDPTQPRGYMTAPYKPTFWDMFGCSYFPNAGARGSADEKEWMIKKKTHIIRNTGRFVVVADWSFSSLYFMAGSTGGLPWTYGYWHDKKEAGWGNVGFQDGHVGYLQGTLDEDNPDYQKGREWTFLHN